MFFESKDKYNCYYEDIERIVNLELLVHITAHMDIMYLEHQGKDKVIFEMSGQITASTVGITNREKKLLLVSKSPNSQEIHRV